jgi:acyl-CoA synthetase (AMP-forming)/AMP-acid ligase II
MDFLETDVIYSPLPLYHMSAGVLVVGLALFNGCTTALARKFSASKYWTDCIKYDATVRSSETLPSFHGLWQWAWRYYVQCQ